MNCVGKINDAFLSVVHKYEITHVIAQYSCIKALVFSTPLLDII